ncbi:MAG: pseudaminic acid biosynthesis-associated methylase [Candidatus Omnitrophota bacterium]
MTNKQAKMWQGDFGTEYIERNYYSPAELDGFYKRNFGSTRTQFNTAFLGKLNRDIRILEVGCNVGNQLLLLQKMGFRNLYGIEINKVAIEKAKTRGQGLNVVYGEAQDIPFKDGFFDLVFTAGVLIHIPPKDIKRVMGEIARCSAKYVWGCESYAKEYQPVVYRGNKNLYWKTDFCSLYEQYCPSLRRSKVQMMKYLSQDLYDYMYLLKKKGSNA